MPCPPPSRSTLPHRPAPELADTSPPTASTRSRALRPLPWFLRSAWRLIVRVLFRLPHRDMSRTVRPSFRDSRFVLLVAGQTVNSVGGWASAIVLWGFAAYRLNAGPYAVSVTIICWAAPPALLSPLLGVYIDRIGPGRRCLRRAGRRTARGQRRTGSVRLPGRLHRRCGQLPDRRCRRRAAPAPAWPRANAPSRTLWLVAPTV